MVVQKLVLVGVLGWAACSSQRPAGNRVTCGPGTALVNNVCEIRPDDGRADAGATDGGSADASVDAPADAGASGTAATSFGIDLAHDNVQPTDIVMSPLTPRWTATFIGPVSYPLVANGSVFVSSAGAQPTVTALDITSGATLWGPLAFGNRVMLAYDSGRLFALDFNGNLSARDAATGAQLWNTQVQVQSFYYAPPVAAGGVVYLNGVGVGGDLIAIDEQTGAALWHVATGGTEGGATIANGVLYVDEPCEFLAFAPSSGSLLWARQLGCSGGGGVAASVYGTKIWDRNATFGNVILDANGTYVGSFSATALPAFHGDVAFYPTSAGLLAVDIASSKLRWSFTGDGQLCTSPVVAGAGGQIFVASQSGNVYELDETTGAQRSVHNAGTSITCSNESNSMSLAGGHLLVPAGNELVVY